MPHIQFAINIAFTDYYPFGSPMPGRNSNSADYRFGFNGQEMDNEISGEGNSLEFKYRIYDSRLGRFLSIDPLAKKFPWWTPYQFAGNMPIQFKELEGAEPQEGDLNFNNNIVFCNKTTVDAVNVSSNCNWNAYEADNIFDAKQKISDIKQTTININNVYIQCHGMSGKLYLDFGMNSTTSSGGLSSSMLVTVEGINQYLEYKGLPGECEKNEYLASHSALQFQMEIIQSVEDIMNSVADGGTVIFGGCFGGNVNEKNGDLLQAMQSLAGDRISIYMNQDGTHVNKKGESFLDVPLTQGVPGTLSNDNFVKGWSKSTPNIGVCNTGQDLQLNSENEPYEETR